jgi:hypothetical protein
LRAFIRWLVQDKHVGGAAMGCLHVLSGADGEEFGQVSQAIAEAQAVPIEPSERPELSTARAEIAPPVSVEEETRDLQELLRRFLVSPNCGGRTTASRVRSVFVRMFRDLGIVSADKLSAAAALGWLDRDMAADVITRKTATVRKSILAGFFNWLVDSQGLDSLAPEAQKLAARREWPRPDHAERGAA